MCQNSAKPELGIETKITRCHSCYLSLCQNSAKPELGIETDRCVLLVEFYNRQNSAKPELGIETASTKAAPIRNRCVRTALSPN